MALYYAAHLTVYNIYQDNYTRLRMAAGTFF